MNRAKLAYQMLKERGTVRMGDVPREGAFNVYLARNAFAEAKPLAAADGFVITHAYGDGFENNSYTLVKIEAEVDGGIVKAVCHKCGTVFEARERDLKRGFGRYCTRRCAGAMKGKPRANVNSLARPEIGVQPALL